MLSLTHTQERVALEAHIHPRSGVSGGISHTCQWIATNNCIDTSELLVIGYGLPGSKLCHLRLIERNLNLQMIKFLDCVILKCFITITDNKELEGAQQPHADARPWTVAAMPLSIPFSLIMWTLTCLMWATQCKRHPQKQKILTPTPCSLTSPCCSSVFM